MSEIIHHYFPKDDEVREWQNRINKWWKEMKEYKGFEFYED
jgi:hypothetical protein